MLGRAITIVAALALGMAPATALATPLDVASTHAYIQADYALAHASEAKVGAAEANILALNQKLGRACPNVGAGAPENEESQPLSYEVAVALWSVAFGTDAGPIRTFANTVKRLQWSDRRLTRIAHTYATSLHELATLPTPDLCADVRAWKASGFKTIPAITTSLDRRVEAIAPKTIPASLLALYVQPADKGTLARTMRLETKLEETEIGVGLTDWDLVLETLGLHQ